MASQTYTQCAVKGQGKIFATFRNDTRQGRIDFQIRNYGLNAITVKIDESEVDGSLAANLVGDTEIEPGGGVVSLAVNSAKGMLTLSSGSGNTGNSNVYVQAQFLGHTFYGGNISEMETINRSGFYDGDDIPGGVRD
jgi:hypothetical protein